MKSYTDLEQSKALAKILPSESADMFYADLLVDGVHKYNLHPLESYGFKTFEDTKLKASDHLGFVPCWSLAALLNILHSRQNDIPSLSGGGYKDGNYISDWCLDYEYNNGDYQKTFADNAVDACYEMIIKLYELNLL